MFLKMMSVFYCCYFIFTNKDFKHRWKYYINHLILMVENEDLDYRARYRIIV
ncbi:hypothetical protein ICU_04692 [Bacillus cereus BAG2X1-1]|nr:hypothetical protein ICU_04692 [Bacillus cereus BAG2X1-1]